MKWAIIAVLVLAGVVWGVVRLVDAGKGIGKDTVVLKDSTRMTVPLARYQDGVFVYKKENLRNGRIPVDDIQRIAFSTLGDDQSPHTLTTTDGQKRLCRFIKYDRGEFTLKDPKGRQIKGNISKVRTIDF